MLHKVSFEWISKSKLPPKVSCTKDSTQMAPSTSHDGDPRLQTLQSQSLADGVNTIPSAGQSPATSRNHCEQSCCVSHWWIIGRLPRCLVGNCSQEFFMPEVACNKKVYRCSAKCFDAFVDLGCWQVNGDDKNLLDTFCWRDKHKQIARDFGFYFSKTISKQRSAFGKEQLDRQYDLSTDKLLRRAKSYELHVDWVSAGGY